MSQSYVSYESAVSLGRFDGVRGKPLRRASAIDQMSPALDDLSLKFVLWTRDARHDGLDVGCGDGLVTAAALARGGHVTAVDPEQRALLRLLARIPVGASPHGVAVWPQPGRYSLGHTGNMR